jgi:DNA-binding transcriptional MerR regulator
LPLNTTHRLALTRRLLLLTLLSAERLRVAQITKKRVDGLTVGELAAKLAPIAEDRPAPASGDVEGVMASMEPPDTGAFSGTVHAATVQKIRHWTREGWLSPVGKLHTGTGAYRRFDDAAIYDAALLYLLTGAGFTISAMDQLTEALAATRRSLPKWREQGGPLYLVISRSGTRNAIEVVEQAPAAAAVDLAVVVNLGRLWSRVGGGNNGPSDK